MAADPRELLDSLPELVLVVDEDGIVRDGNATVTTVLGYSREEFVDHPAADFVHPDDVAYALQCLASRLATPGPGLPVEFRVVTRSGDIRLCEVVGVDRRNRPGVAGVVTSIRDVTRRAALADSPERLRALVNNSSDFRDVFDHAPIGMALLDAERRFVQVNRALARLVGADPAWFLGESLDRIVEPGERVSDLTLEFDDPSILLGGDHTQVERRLVRADGRALWVRLGLSVMRDADGAVDHVIAHFEDVTARKEIERLLRDQNERLSLQANHDALTGLPNRTRFEGTLERLADGPEQRVAVLFCDLDGFKVVNDNFGHDAGDAVLVEVAVRLRGAVRDGDTVARYGGDEFVVLCTGDVDSEGLVALADRIDATVREPVVLAGTSASIGVSVGIADAWTTDDDLGLVTPRADRAMYRAKSAGKGQYSFF